MVLMCIALSMVSCGGGDSESSTGSTSTPPGDGIGGDGGTGNEPTPTTEISLPPVQKSTTDSAGQVSFVTSEGVVVNLKVIDSISQQSLSNISLSFEENQNDVFVTTIEDTRGTYIPVINLNSIEPYTPSLQRSAEVVPLGSSIIELIIEMIPFSSLGTALYQHNLGIDYLIESNTSFLPFGTIKDVKYMTVQDYIDLKKQIIDELGEYERLFIDIGIDLLTLGFSIPAKVLLGIGKEGVTTFEEANEQLKVQLTIDYLFASGIIDTNSTENALSKKIKVYYEILYTNNTFLPTIKLTPSKCDFCQSLLQVPTAPTSLFGTVISSSRINLSWNNSSWASGYIIEHSNDGINFEQVPLCVGPNTTTFTHKYLIPSTLYYYQIYALNANGRSGYSNIIQITTLPLIDIVPPSIPTELVTFIISSSQINISWSTSPENDVAGYTIYRYEEEEFIRNVSSNSIFDVDLSPNTEYCYAVSVFDTSGNESDKSVYMCATTNTIPSPNTSSSYYTNDNPYYPQYGGQCTAFAWGRSLEKLGIKLTFYDGTQTRYPSGKHWILWNTNGFTSGTRPKPNSIAVWEGDQSNTHGHVAYIEDVIGDTIYFNEANVFPNYINTDYGGGYTGSLRARKIDEIRDRGNGIGKLIGYLYLQPVLSTNSTLSISTSSLGPWSTSETGIQGITFYFVGSGYSQNTTATRYITTPNGTTITAPISVNGSGNLYWSWPSGCASPGTYTIYLKDDTGVASNTITETITSSSSCSTTPLFIDSITPPSVYKETMVTFTLSGTGFQSGFLAKLVNEDDIEYNVSSTQFINSTFVKVKVYLGSGPTSTQQIRIINPDGQIDQKSFIALVLSPAPTLSVNPTSGSQGTIFNYIGNGYTSNGTIEWHVQKPDDTEYLPADLADKIDSSGNFSHSYLSHCDSIVGTYKIWAIDKITGKSSPMVTESIMASESCVSVQYEGHFAYTGWMEYWAQDGQTAGTADGNQMEAIKIQTTDYGITYRAHVAFDGWQGWVSNGSTAGTIGQAKSLQAIEINLVGAPANLHVSYRVYVEGQGWQAWVSDGTTAGTTGLGLAVQAIDIKIQD